MNVSETIYKETLVELRARIESESGSLQSFAEKNGIDKFNLYKVFNRTRGQEMSIGLFARICEGLGNPVAEQIPNSNLSLKQYLAIDNNAVLKCIMFVNFATASLTRITPDE